MFPTAVGEPEMIQAMREGLAGDGDVEAVGYGEIGQGLSTGVVAAPPDAWVSWPVGVPEMPGTS